MSMMRCDRHGAWDSDNWETCPRCGSELEYLQSRVEDLTRERDELKVRVDAVFDIREWEKEKEKLKPNIDIKMMVDRFLRWPLPKTFAPDCGISFDGRKPDAWNPARTWPVGTNLLTADEARQMVEFMLGTEQETVDAAQEGYPGIAHDFEQTKLQCVALRDALSKLVNLKTLKDANEYLDQNGVKCWRFPSDEAFYKVEQPKAWDAARKALAETLT